MSVLRARKTARHARPSRTAPVLAAGGLTAAFAVADAGALASAASAASGDDFAQLRQCESGGNYATNTGNGFYGAYQFDAGTWHGLGYGGLPSSASPGTQDAAAARLQSERGWQPWPACSRRLGLESGRASRSRAIPARGYSAPVVAETVLAPQLAPAPAPAPARAAQVVVALAPSAPPPFHASVLSTKDGHGFRVGVQMWQARMAARGWDIAADGIFGPRTARVAARFAAQKGLTPPVLGEVDETVWNAAWVLPVN